MTGKGYDRNVVFTVPMNAVSSSGLLMTGSTGNPAKTFVTLVRNVWSIT